MASFVFSPIRPHFFQPLLPGFHRHLTVPVAFFMRHIKGKDGPKAAELRSGRRERSWKVKMEGRRFTDGWEEFAVDHGFKVGDVLLFRHEGGLVFHVTAFGPSCCQIQYAPFLPEDGDEDVNYRDDCNDDDVVDLRRKKKGKKNPKTEVDLSDHTCFTAAVTVPGLRRDTLHLPRKFARWNRLENKDGEIILLNRRGGSWTLGLKHNIFSGQVYINRGWRGFCRANGLRTRGFCRFKLVRNNRAKPVLQLISIESTSDINNSRESVKTKHKVAVDAKFGNKNNSGKSLKTKKTHRRWRVSSVPRENRFLTLNLSPYSFSSSKLHLPKPFAQANCLDKPGQKITLLDKDGTEWPTYLWLEKPANRVGLGKGWKDFCRANYVEIGESFTLELIWGDTGPMLRFCSKVKIEQ